MSKVFFIAEAGKNFIDHDWKEKQFTIPYYLERAQMLVRAAKKAGADAVKFQCHVFEDEAAFRGVHRHDWIKFNESITTEGFWKELKAYCDSLEIEFMCTPMSKMAAEKINPFVKRWKVGSGNVTDMELLKFMAETKKPVILSTGMSTQIEVGIATHILKDNELSLLYCKSIYPCPSEQVNLAMIQRLKDVGKVVGFSDHTTDITMPMKATIRGAEIIEKHFTLCKEDVGPDHKFSLEPHELTWAIKLVRDYERYDNLGDVVLWPEEDEIRLRMKFNA